MKELSLNILDIAKNSVKAKADLIEITINEDTENDLLSIKIKDDGIGMSKEFLEKVRDPFTTTRTTRKFGMGIPLFELAAIQAEGSFQISSEENIGTDVEASFKYSSIDRAPLGDITGTMVTLISGSPEIDFLYKHIYSGKEFVFDTREVREALGNDVSLAENEVLTWISGCLNEGIEEIKQ